MLRHLIIVMAIAGLCFGPAALVSPSSAADPAPARPEAGSEQRLALIIGNATYRDTPLKNPANDAKAMAATLRRLGFTVMLVTDAPLRQMQQAILDFGEKLRGGGVGLFYYAGHGVQVRGHNYLVPVDADITTEASVRVAALPVDLVTEQMDEARNRVNVVILDACRNNPFERRLRGGSRGLAAMDAARGTLVAYATAPGAVALDGDGDNGLYTSELLKALGEPDLKAEEVFKRVRANVVKRTGGKQTPWESSSLTGDFVFNLTINVAPAPAAGAFDERQIELAYWNSIVGSANAALFRAYLEQYPKGTFAALARFRIEDLERTPPQTASVAPPPPPGEPPVPADEAFRRGEEAFRRKDYPQALPWFRKAAEQGHADAQVHLGLMHRGGLGVPRDYAQARQWFRKAAEQGHAEAQYNVAVLYERGWGGRRDPAQARTWFRKAAENGSADAAKALLRLEQAAVQDDAPQAPGDGAGATPRPAGRAKPPPPPPAAEPPAGSAGGSADGNHDTLKQMLKQNWLR